MEQCKSKKKSLVVEDLNFKQLKTRMLYRPKTQNKTLSSFAYKKIIEKVERKCLMNEVDVIKVDPRKRNIQKKIIFMRCRYWIQISKD